uniref:Immunoglobulin superfamily, member 3-like n=1 Tax=Sparus aurata TaxID=8175 RepID=A0A671WE40_SPAAU
MCVILSDFLLLTLLIDVREAIVHTEAQAGPLYRVVGSPLSISCNVSGFSNPDAEQEFEVRVKKPANPTFEINIISTGNNDFGYAIYLDRVRSKEITLTHVSPTAVVFEIQRLQKNDEGEFECSVKNSENVYLGTYSAHTVVKVIDNSLSVSSPASTSLSYNEGEALMLTCQASSNTVQHTHLSIAWYLRKDGEDDPRPIISLDRDFTLSPGPGFEGRYQAGLVRLDKIGEATYRLKMDQLEVSDQGQIYCQAREWIQDPDRSWYAITQADAAETTVNVRARDTSSLVVRISAQPPTLQEGQELSLSCNIDTEKLRERFFSVAWRKGGVELARIGPTGILSVGPEYSVRGQEGELRAARVGSKDYRLILQPVRTDDHGVYICTAWPQDRGQDVLQIVTQSPSDETVHKIFLNTVVVMSNFILPNMSLVSSQKVVNERDKLVLTCKVLGVKGQLSVTWQHKATSAAIFTNVISLSQEGVMETGGEFSRRRVKATRPTTDTFTLELDEVTPSDSGVYQCAVSEWKTNSKTNSQSQTATVTVEPVESYVKVNLVSRDNIVTVGDDVALMCRVRGPHVPITLTWSLQRDATNLDNILTLNYDGAVSWSAGVEQSYQLKVENKPNEVRYHLLIHGASQREAGSYQCSASVFIENLAVKVNKPAYRTQLSLFLLVSKLDLTSAPALTSNINTDLEIKCSVISTTSASSRYAVTWLLQQQAEKQIIVSSDRDALLAFGPQVELSHRQRISMKHTKGPSFELSIRQAQISDGGSYTCEVVEWLQDPRGDWYELSPVSRTTNVTVLEPGNPSFFYKVTWLYTEHDSSITNALVELDHRGLLSYPENQKLRGLQGRLRLSRPAQSSFHLGIQRAHEGDGGTYKCQVEQHQLDHEGRWQQKASESAGPITLTVNVPGMMTSF